MKKLLLIITYLLIYSYLISQELNFKIGDEWYYRKLKIDRYDHSNDITTFIQKQVVDTTTEGYLRIAISEIYDEKIINESYEYWDLKNNIYSIMFSNLTSFEINSFIELYDKNDKDSSSLFTTSGWYIVNDSVTVLGIKTKVQSRGSYQAAHTFESNFQRVTSEDLGLYYQNETKSPNTFILELNLIGAKINGAYYGTLNNVKPTASVLSYSLSQNYPNPFNPTTTIRYQIPQAGFVSLKVYDILGKEVTTLVNEEKPAEVYNIVFDGSSLSSGIYFYKLQSGSYTETKKLILMR